MTPVGPLPEFVWELVQQLRRRQIAVGIDDLMALREALQAGFGTQSPTALRELLVLLWAKSPAEAAIVRAQFDQADLDEWDLAQPSPPDEAGSDDAVRASGTGTITSGSAGVGPPQPERRAVTQPVSSFPALPGWAGKGFSGHNLVPQYPVTQRTVAQTWRRLRRPVRSGPPVELDVDATIERRFQRGVATPPVVMPRRRNVAKLMLLVDRKGSMTPYHGFIDEVLTAITRQSSLAHVWVWYFHDVPAEGAPLAPLEAAGDGLAPVLDEALADIHPYDEGFVYTDPELVDPKPLDEAMTVLGPDVGVTVISDAGAARGHYDAVRLLDTLAFARAVRSRRSRLVWLNPTPALRWRHSTAEQIARHLPMSEIDAMGMHRAVNVLRGHPPQVERPL
jgi:uncharacterized protein with von Willebrand factor type A (vWA) domain